MTVIDSRYEFSVERELEDAIDKLRVLGSLVDSLIEENDHLVKLLQRKHAALASADIAIKELQAIVAGGR